MSEGPNTSVSSQGFEYGVKHFLAPTASTLTELLFAVLKLSEKETGDLLNLGAVYVNNLRQTQNIRVEANQLCRVHTKPRRYDCSHNWTELIVYENQDFLILNKPSGIPSHPSVDNILENSLTQTAKARGLTLHITHRLDTLTSGLIVYAKNQNFVKNFNIQMQEQNVEKKYVALVESSKELPRSVIHYMEPSPRAPKKVSSYFMENWLQCELEILEQKKIKSNLSWVKINLITGRTHQIRAQLSDLGAPVLGDKQYGALAENPSGGIALRSCELQFNWGSERLVVNIAEDFDI